MARSLNISGQEIGRALRTPVNSEVLYVQQLGRFTRSPYFATVVYDGTEHHYVPTDHFWCGPVVAKWIVPGIEN